MKKNDFMNEIKYDKSEIHDNLEAVDVYRIQELYESNRINLDELSDEKVAELNDLYRKQIKVLEEKIKREKSNQAG